MNYFKRVLDWHSNKSPKLKEEVKYIRKVDDSPRKVKEWCKSTNHLLEFELVYQGGVEDQNFSNKLEVDFANKLVGGGAVKGGTVQEEIMFMINPECIPAIMFFEELDDNEVGYIVGADKINKCSGYKQTFKFVGDFIEKETNQNNLKKDKPVDMKNHKIANENVIVAMDAIHFQSLKEQFIKENLLRELNKAVLGFDYSKSIGTIVTGKWGCGIFKGDPLLKFMIQWIAASECSKIMKFCILGDVFFQNNENLLRSFMGKSVGQISDILFKYDVSMNIDFIDYLKNQTKKFFNFD